MTTFQTIKFWVSYNSIATRVSVPNDAIVDDLKRAASQEYSGIKPGDISLYQRNNPSEALPVGFPVARIKEGKTEHDPLLIQSASTGNGDKTPLFSVSVDGSAFVNSNLERLEQQQAERPINPHQVWQLFLNVLQGRNITTHEAVLSKIIANHAKAVEFAVAESQRGNLMPVIELYDSVESAPGTETKMVIRQNADLLVDGPLSNAGTGLYKAISAITGAPSVLKHANMNEVDVCKALATCSHQGKDYIMKMQLIQYQHVGNKTLDFGGIIMPMLPGTVAEYPALPHNVLLERGRNIHSALEALHSLGWVHMDVKASNIFVDHLGQWLLGDFDVSRRTGQEIGATSLVFFPYPVMKSPAHPKYDFYLLGVMLLIEATCKESLGMITDTKKNHVCVDKMTHQLDLIYHIELKSFVRNLLQSIQS